MPKPTQLLRISRHDPTTPQGGQGNGVQRFRMPALSSMVLLFSILPGCQVFRHSPDQDVARARWFTNLGYDALQRNQIDRAKGCFSKACLACPEDERLRKNLADVHRQSGHYHQAIAELNQVLDSGDSQPETHIELGELYLLEGQLQPALRHAETAIGLGRRSAKAWALKGKVHAANGKHDRACHCYNRALTLAGKNDFASSGMDQNQLRCHLADSLIERKKFHKAMVVLESASSQFPRNQQPVELAILRGRLFAKMNLPEKSLEILTRAVESPNATAEVFVQLSLYQQQLGDASAAHRTLAQARQKFPKHEGIHQRMASLNSDRPEMVIR